MLSRASGSVNRSLLVRNVSAPTNSVQENKNAYRIVVAMPGTTSGQGHGGEQGEERWSVSGLSLHVQVLQDVFGAKLQRAPERSGRRCGCDAGPQYLRARARPIVRGGCSWWSRMSVSASRKSFASPSYGTWAKLVNPPISARSPAGLAHHE